MFSRSCNKSWRGWWEIRCPCPASHTSHIGSPRCVEFRSLLLCDGGTHLSPFLIACSLILANQGSFPNRLLLDICKPRMWKASLWRRKLLWRPPWRVPFWMGLFCPSFSNCLEVRGETLAFHPFFFGQGKTTGHDVTLSFLRRAVLL